jgi:hypothetical protein
MEVLEAFPRGKGLLLTLLPIFPGMVNVFACKASPRVSLWLSKPE